MEYKDEYIMQISTNVQKTTVAVALESPALTLWAATGVVLPVHMVILEMEELA